MKIVLSWRHWPSRLPGSAFAPDKPIEFRLIAGTTNPVGCIDPAMSRVASMTNKG